MDVEMWHEELIISQMPSDKMFAFFFFPLGVHKKLSPAI